MSRAMVIGIAVAVVIALVILYSQGLLGNAAVS